MSQDLNARQRDAVQYLDGPLLVLAGAGSGKTRVITRKIAYLIETVGLQARHVAAVTFTNKAAREMKERVGKLLEGSNTRGLSISTFHTMGLNILRREHKHLGFKAGFSILDEHDTQHLLSELTEQNEPDKETLALLRRRISDWKNDLIMPQQAMVNAEDDIVAWQARVYEAFQRALRAYNAVDFDDLITLPVDLLRHHTQVREHWQNRVRHLLVDEYQDTNNAQYELVKLLVGIREGLTVVGDDDQSIYAWRGARPENLVRLKQDFPRLNVIKLEQNYRSSGRILRAANALIANNPHVFEKRLWCDLGAGDPLRVLSFKDDEQEAERVVSDILHHKFMHRTQFDDYAILYRGNHQSRPFEKALRVNNIPYFISGGNSFFSRTEIKDTMAYLRLLANSEDDVAFLRVVNTPRREIGPVTLEKLSAYANKRQTAMLNACQELGIEQVLPRKPLKKLRELHVWLGTLARATEYQDPVQTVRRMLQDIDYEQWLHQTSPNNTAAEKRWANVKDLVAWLERLREDDLKGNTLTEMVSHLSLMDVIERQDEESDGDRVRLMTLHAAKGLEFPYVYLVGVEEELLPHRTSIEDENIEEERRLAYVGITRSQRILTMTCAAKRRRGGELTACEPSRFLAELPEDDLVWEGRNPKLSVEEKKQRGNAHLANLKSMLGS